jgi:dihydroflavonol-4-reductase
MRALVTGATGFIGGRLAKLLVERGHDVTALVRSPDRAAPLREAGVRLIAGDVTEPATLTGPMRHAEVVYHLAAWYQIGVTDRTGMFQVNVRGTEHVLDAAAAAGVGRIVYCSSAAALGLQPIGETSDENTQHHGRFSSTYEETKWIAHHKARERMAAGVPIVTVMPGAVYGQDDPSIMGVMLRFYSRGWMIAHPFLSSEVSWVHVDDVAEGIALAAEKGRIGEDYCLGGENLSIRDMLRSIEPHTGIRAPRFEIPMTLVRMSVPLSPLVGRMLKQPSGIIREGITSLGNGSWMMSSSKARRELGYEYRGVTEAMVETVEWLKENK